MPAEKTRKGLKMKELEDLTGESRATILYWLSQGLLPPPEKTSANMSWYDARYPRLIEAIRLLQKRMNHSIADIRAFVDQQGGPMALLGVRERIDDFLFGGASPLSPRMSREELLESAGIEPHTLDRMLELGIVRPEKPGEFDEGDRNAASKVNFLNSIGIPLEDLAFYGKAADSVARLEREMVQRQWEVHPPEDIDRAKANAQRELTFARQYYFGRAFRREVEEAAQGFKGAGPESAGRKGESER
jgi:DNA-binding transcriptional MerR regulator